MNQNEDYNSLALSETIMLKQNVISDSQIYIPSSYYWQSQWHLFTFRIYMLHK